VMIERGGDLEIQWSKQLLKEKSQNSADGKEVKNPETANGNEDDND